MNPCQSDDNIQRLIEVASGINITKPTSNGISEPKSKSWAKSAVTLREQTLSSRECSLLSHK